MNWKYALIIDTCALKEEYYAQTVSVGLVGRHVFIIMYCLVIIYFMRCACIPVVLLSSST